MLFSIALGAADQSFIYIEELFFGGNVILYPIALCALSQVQCSGQGLAGVDLSLDRLL